MREIGQEKSAYGCFEPSALFLLSRPVEAEVVFRDVHDRCVCSIAESISLFISAEKSASFISYSFFTPLRLQ